MNQASLKIHKKNYYKQTLEKSKVKVIRYGHSKNPPPPTTNAIFTCNQCDLVFTSESGKIDHYQKVHSVAKVSLSNRSIFIDPHQTKL